MPRSLHLVVSIVTRAFALSLTVIPAVRAAGAGAEPPPPLIFEQMEQVIEVGFHPRPFLVDFLFRVGGDAPVSVSNFSTSCPCTTVAMERTDFFPGQKGVITALYEFRGDADLEVQVVTVRTNRSRQPQHLRIVPERSRGELWLERTELRWLRAQGGASQSFDVEMAPARGDAVPWAEVSAGGWNVAIAPTEVTGRYRVTVTPTVEQPPVAEIVFLLPGGTPAGLADPGPDGRVKLIPAES